MSVHEQYYITCNNCGVALSDNLDDLEIGVTQGEIRDLANDEGWGFDGEDGDYCKKCGI